MAQIVLTRDQVRTLAEAREPVELRDEQGRLLACVPVSAAGEPNDKQDQTSPAVHRADWSRDEIDAARRSLASHQRRWSSEQVKQLFAELTAMQERDQVDAAKLQEVLTRFRSNEHG